eukprot:TRINITY_DN491_c0_g1_i3.p2 TRINITY_DN491_c0_g1~~TRINITY_DN491_c0_g1_i3.p2  ORF type:complete len:203 (+),score=91.78 TRINITY_DN491_c0_g1_i3:87-611(+)
MSWSDCVAELVADSLSEYTAQLECTRYLQMPAQATAYMLGDLQLLALRNETAAALAAGGRRFDPAEFHAVVLKWGPMGLSDLRALMATYVAWRLDPDGDALRGAFGADIIATELFAHGRPFVGLGRAAAAPPPLAPLDTAPAASHQTKAAPSSRERRRYYNHLHAGAKGRYLVD